MATSPNFSWPEPDNTDLVKNGALAIRTAVDAIDTSMVDLKGGTTGQILSKTSNTDMDFTWITNDVGDITAVTAGSGLSGGGTSGAVSLALDLASANVFTAAQSATRFLVTGSTVATNGIYLPSANTLGFSTNSTEKMQIDANGKIGIGSGTVATNVLTIVTAITGGVTSAGISINSTISSDATTGARVYNSFVSTAASAFTLVTLSHYRASLAAIGAGSAITNQIGFNAETTLIGATNNYGFFGNIASGSGRWNFFASGTAANFFLGRTGIGAGITSTYQMRVSNVQSATDVTLAVTNFAAQTADSIIVQDSSSNLLWAVTSAGLMEYISGNTATTVGAAGLASALPALPTGYLKIDIGGTTFKVPYYAN